MFYRVQAFCDLLDSRKEPFGFPIDPFSSALSLRGPLVHPRPDLRYQGIDLFERIAQRGQRLEQVVPVKAPEVDGAGVPGVLKEGQPGPHSRGPQAPFLGVMVSASAESTCSARIWNLLLRWTSSLQGKPLSGLLRFAGFGDTPHIPCVAHIFGATPSDRSYDIPRKNI